MVFSKSSAEVYSLSLISASTPSSSPPTTPISTSRMIFASAASFNSSLPISRFSSIGTGDHVLDPQAGAELGATGGELDDAVAAGVREALHGGVDAFRADTVDCRE